jgi:phosphoglycerate dehydrogenase-like enzyme
MKLAILDDYGRPARRVADWSGIARDVEITDFDRPIRFDEVADMLAPFDILCTMRERMAIRGELIARLPRLKLITIVFPRQDNLDVVAATAHGILVAVAPPAPLGTPDNTRATVELTWALILNAVRHLEQEMRAMRAGGWASSYGIQLHGRTLGLLGFGRLGRQMAAIGQAFGMKILVWSQNLDAAAAIAAGVIPVAKDELFARSDVLSIHTRLSDRTRGLVGAGNLARMKPDALLVNTSRGPIVDEDALIECLRAGRIAGAALDVYDQEPLPSDHPLRGLSNVTLTPHIGYVSEQALAMFYAGTIAVAEAFLRHAPISMLNPEVLTMPRLAELGPWREGQWPTAWPIGV